MSNHQEPQQPTIILIRGLPGSGKTYIASALCRALGEDKVVMLDPDGTDYSSKEYAEHVKAQTAEGVDPTLHAYRFLRAKAYDGIAEGKMIIWNQPFTNLEIFHKMVGRLQDHAREHHKQLNMLVVEVEVDRELAKQRMLARKQTGGHGPSEETFSRFVNDYKSFAGQGFNTVTVDGEAEVSDSVAKIKNALESLNN